VKDKPDDRKIQFLIHFFMTLAKLIRLGGVKTMLTENLMLEQSGTNLPQLFL
jgi:hypothetical protein